MSRPEDVDKVVDETGNVRGLSVIYVDSANLPF